MAAENDGGHVFDRDLEFLGDEGAEAGRIENAGHADDAVFREFRDHVRDLRHGVERIGDDDDDGVGRNGGGLFGGGFDDFVVGEQKVVAAHAGFAGEAGGDDDDVGIRGGRVIVGSGDADVVAFDGTGLEEVEPFALRDAFSHVYENDVSEFLFGGPDGTVGADVSGADDGDFISQSTNSFPTEVEYEGEKIRL